MIKREIDSLIWEDRNVVRRVFYHSSTQQAGSARSITYEQEAIDPNFPQLSVNNQVPTSRTTAPGATILDGVFCEGTDGITLKAKASAPYAQAIEDPTATACAVPPANECDLAAVKVSQSDTEVLFNVTTSHLPFYGSIDGTTFFESRNSWAGLAPSSSYAFYFKDAHNCALPPIQVVMDDPTPFPVPAGVRIDSFEDQGEILGLYYQATPTPRVVVYSPSGRANFSIVTEATRNRLSGSSFSANPVICQGTSEVRFLTRLVAPYATVALTANAVACGYTPPVAPLALVSLSEHPATADHPTFGQAELLVSGGTAPITVTGPGVPTRTLDFQGYTDINIAPGQYVATVTDSSTPAQTLTVPFSIGEYGRAGCRTPGALNYDPLATVDGEVCVFAPAVEAAVLAVPAPNSLRFVVPTNGLPTAANTLLRDQRQVGVPVADYCQKVAKADLLTIQFKSNFATHRVQLRTLDTRQTMRNFEAVRVVQGEGNVADFAGYLRAGAVASQARIYFNAAALPLPFVPGNPLSISGTGTALDGSYPIISVREDAAEGVPYLVINAPYATISTAQRLEATISTAYDLQAFDTYQTAISFAGNIPEGCYEVVITGMDPVLGSARAISEPIDLKDSHRDTLLLTYRNFDNAFAVNYSFGIEHRLRVVGRLRAEPVATNKQVLEESNSRTTLLSATARKRELLEVFQLPDYMHEKLALVFSHDLVRVQGVEYVAEGSWEVSALPRFRLWNGSTVLTQRDWLGTGNSDDLGDLNQGGDGFIIANDGLLKL